jgi:hypothetical protein
MLRLKRSSLFWTLLVVAVMLPAGLLATGKRLYHANISDATGAGKGTAVIVARPGSWEYLAKTFALPGGAVNQAWLAPSDGSWQIALCTNGGPVEDDCTYGADGNLEIEGPISATMLIAAGVTGRQFHGALTGGDLAVVVSDGSTALGWGYFVRII